MHAVAERCHLCPGSSMLAKISKQIIFAIVAKEKIDQKIMTKSFTNIAKIDPGHISSL